MLEVLWLIFPTAQRISALIVFIVIPFLQIAIVLTCVSALYAYAVVPKHNGYSYHTVHEHKPHHHHHGGEEYHHQGGEEYHHHGGEEHHFEVHHSQPEYGALGHGGYGGIVEAEHYGGGGGYAHHDEEHHVGCVGTGLNVK